MNKIKSLYFVIFFILICLFSMCQQSISAQTLEEMLEKAQEDIAGARESGIPLGSVSILSNSSHTDSTGILHVVGEVYNDMAPNTAKDVQVIATFYDLNNKVVGTSSEFITPRDLASGEKAPFDIKLTSASIPVDEIDHNSLKIDWK